MAKWLVLFIAIIYLIVAIDFLRQGKFALSLMFVGYFVGNIGIYYLGGE